MLRLFISQETVLTKTIIGYRMKASEATRETVIIMNTNFCYSGYTWRVFQHNRFVGYVHSSSANHAYLIAKEKYGDYIWVERVMVS